MKIAYSNKNKAFITDLYYISLAIGRELCYTQKKQSKGQI